MTIQNRMNEHSIWIILAIFSFSLIGCQTLKTAEPLSPERFEDDILKFEELDRESFPPKNAILFVGSSSIRGWDEKHSFPKLKTINRGFGGSQMEDCLYYMDRIVLPYQPKTIVLYEGDNDINKKKPPRRVYEDYLEFVKRVHEQLPRTKIIFIAIKPSIKRWNLVDKMREANRLIREYTRRDERLVYLDIDTPMIGEDGKPKSDIFKEDGLHLSEKGYEIWAKVLKPHLWVDRNKEFLLLFSRRD